MLDWYSRKGSIDSLWFYGYIKCVLKAFSWIIFREKNTLIIKIAALKISLNLKLNGWRYAAMNNLQCFVQFSKYLALRSC